MRNAKRAVHGVIDLFCGGGGTSTGCAQAAKESGFGLDLLAVNHWPIAVETHKRNHPWAKHLCESLDSINPRDVAEPGKVKMLVASPECTHHSIARGGKPINEQSRATAWCVLRWADALGPENILIENVKEFRTWGPIGSNGRPLQSKKGITFDAFLQALESLGYKVEHRVLNAADYGGATTRERLFIQARRGRKPIRWPQPTHTAAERLNQSDLFRDYKPWRSAREIIDWSIPGQSIFNRKKSLAPATLERIAAGLKKFGGKNAEPFLVILRNHQNARSLSEPIPTITTSGAHFSLCEPFVIGQQSCAAPRSVDMPLPTISTAGAISLVKPFVVPFFGERHGQDPRCHSIDHPLPTVTGHGAGALVEPFLVKYNGTGKANGINEPIDTITAKDRFGLVECDSYYFDIRFRMLQWHELAAAMGFPPSYEFAGNREQKVKQIGNAVEVNKARALCKELLCA